MADRDIYLKIEPVLDYSPVDPEDKVAPPKQFRRDCMRNPGHEDTTIPLSEANARRLTALVYREYLDPSFFVPKPDKLVLADVNEPAFSRRVPGTVIYTHPGERLRIHVFNADSMPHSLHMHGLRYGIDSDGSWPFGTQAEDGRRSDEICPGQQWTYTFDVADEMIGAWPFHDHNRMIGEHINRGLFGGVVVLPRQRHRPPPVLDLPPIAKTFLKEILKERRPHPPVPDPGPLEPPMVGMAAMRMAPTMPLGRMDIEADAVRMFLEEWSQLAYVHPKPRPRDVLHVPLFFHFMARGKGTPAFDSSTFLPGAMPFEVTFGVEGSLS